MARHPKDFPPLFVALVRVGEQTGRLDEILKRLAGWLEFEMKTRERVRTALRYPSFVMIAMAVALIVVNVFVIPRFSAVYKSMKVDLPLMTQILIGMSDFIVNFWPLRVTCPCLAHSAGCGRWRRTCCRRLRRPKTWCRTRRG